MVGTSWSREEIIAVIQQVRSKIRWKPGSDVRHLLKRKVRGHLPTEATLEDYDRVIQTVLSVPNAIVYVYTYKGAIYPTVVAQLAEIYWLVMVSMDGIMESAYVVENPETYLSQPDFELVGLLKEVLQ